MTDRQETSLYDGRHRMGAVVVSGSQFKAESASGKDLGRFTTRQAAAAAVVSHYKKGDA